MNEENNQNGTAGYNFDFANQVNPSEPNGVAPVMPGTPTPAEPTSNPIESAPVMPEAPTPAEPMPNPIESAPVMPEAPASAEPMSNPIESAPVMPEAAVGEPTPVQNAMLTNDSLPQSDLQQSNLVDVSVPVLEGGPDTNGDMAAATPEGQQVASLDNPSVMEESIPVESVPAESTSKFKLDESSKNTIRFVIILGVIIIAAIIALPFIYNFLHSIF